MSDSVTFQDFNLSPKLFKAIDESLKFKIPTPIQALAIPHGMAGKDVMGCASTGTGKTLAFLIPLIELLQKDADATAVIMAPTRELIRQICEEAEKLLEFIPGFRTAMLIGGVPYPKQRRDLAARPKIIIATPGRLQDFLNMGMPILRTSRFVVLDEADRMLDMGFLPQITRVLQSVPKDHQTLLFSATFDKNIQSIAKRFLKNPIELGVKNETHRPAEKITHQVFSCTIDNKIDTLCDVLNARKGSTIIFVRTKSRADRLCRNLVEFGYTATRIHGDRSQKQRFDAIDGFRDKTFRILIASDIAARGIDLPKVEMVVNFDLPKQTEDYVHRVGRSARAGEDGHAVSLVVRDEEVMWKRIVKDLKIKPEVSQAAKQNLGSRKAPPQEREKAVELQEKQAREDVRIDKERGRTREQRSGRGSGRGEEKSFGREKSGGRFSKGNDDRSERPRFSDREEYLAHRKAASASSRSIHDRGFRKAPPKNELIFEKRPAREERAASTERAPRGDRSFSDRPERAPRGDRPSFSDRGERAPRTDRAPREERAPREPGSFSRTAPRDRGAPADGGSLRIKLKRKEEFRSFGPGKSSKKRDE